MRLTPVENRFDDVRREEGTLQNAAHVTSVESSLLGQRSWVGNVSLGDPPIPVVRTGDGLQQRRNRSTGNLAMPVRRQHEAHLTAMAFETRCNVKVQTILVGWKRTSQAVSQKSAAQGSLVYKQFHILLINLHKFQYFPNELIGCPGSSCRRTAPQRISGLGIHAC